MVTLPSGGRYPDLCGSGASAPLQNCFTDTYPVDLLSNYSAPWVLRRPMLFDTCTSSKRAQRTSKYPSSCLLKVLRPLIRLAVDAVLPIGGGCVWSSASNVSKVRFSCWISAFRDPSQRTPSIDKPWDHAAPAALRRGLHRRAGTTAHQRRSATHRFLGIKQRSFGYPALGGQIP